MKFNGFLNNLTSYTPLCGRKWGFLHEHRLCPSPMFMPEFRGRGILFGRMCQCDYRAGRKMSLWPWRVWRVFEISRLPDLTIIHSFILAQLMWAIVVKNPIILPQENLMIGDMIWGTHAVKCYLPQTIAVVHQHIFLICEISFWATFCWSLGGICLFTIISLHDTFKLWKFLFEI